MTPQEFLQKYHAYRADRKDNADRECAKVNKQLTVSNAVVEKSGLGTWCLMLEDAEKHYETDTP